MRWAFISALLFVAFRSGLCSQPQDVIITGLVEPYELLVYRDPETLTCSRAVLRETQVFKNLSPEGYFNAFITEHGDEKIQFIHYDVDYLRREVQSLCRGGEPQVYHDNIDLPILEYPHEQVILSTADSSEPINVNVDLGESNILIEVQKILQSGRSNNRVDFMFLSDGCACCLSPSV